jgi:hypothetical protein
MHARSARQPVSYRAACLALAALFVLAAISGAVATSGSAPHHHRTHVLVAVTAGADIPSVVGRSALDSAPTHSGAAELAAIRFAAAAQPVSAATSAAVHTLRTRGPPATAV